VWEPQLPLGHCEQRLISAMAACSRCSDIHNRYPSLHIQHCSFSNLNCLGFGGQQSGSHSEGLDWGGGRICISLCRNVNFVYIVD